MVVVAALAMTASAAMADELDDAHRLAISGRDSYWNCLAQEYNQDGNKPMSEQDFTRHIADVCPSERQSFRVALIDYLTLQFPNRRCRRPYDQRQQRHRAGAKGRHHRLRQAQGGVEIANRLFIGTIGSTGPFGSSQEKSEMNSEKLAGILGAIVAVIALVAAIVYGPIGQMGKPSAQAQKAEPAAPVAAAPPVRGPVVRDVPQQ